MEILPSEAMPLALAGILPELPQLLAVHNMRGRGRDSPGELRAPGQQRFPALSGRVSLAKLLLTAKAALSSQGEIKGQG